MQSAVERAIISMWENYKEPLSLDDIACSAILSRFHFSRVFRGTTGVPPGRFLSAIRIYEAKRLLVTTSLSVTHISFEVGYNSLGTFTRRFTESVGVSPARFRRMAEMGVYELPGVLRGCSQRPGSMAGCVRLPCGGGHGRLYVATFDTPIAQGQPSSCDSIDFTSADDRALYRLPAVPEGEWYLQAVAIMTETRWPEPLARRSLLVGGAGPVKVVSEEAIEADMELRARRLTDLPILLALPEIDSTPELDISPLSAAGRTPQMHAIRGQGSPAHSRARLRPIAAAPGRAPGRSAGRQPARVESMRHPHRKVDNGLRRPGKVIGP